MIEIAHGFHYVVAQFLDLKLFAQEVEVEKGSDISFFVGGANGVAVEPADEEFKGDVIGIRESICFG